MKRIGIIAIFAAVCLLLLVPGLNVSALEITNELNVEVGQSAEYEMDDSAFREEWEDEAIDVDIKKSKMTFSITGEETIKIGGQSVECWIIKHETDVQFSISGTVEGMSVSADMRMESVRTMWMAKVGRVTMKETEESEQYMKYEIPGFGSMESESTESSERTLTSVPDMWPETIKVGDEWSISEEYEETSESREREKVEDKWGEWTEDTWDDSGTTEADYEVMAEEEVKVKAGTFNCLRIKVTYGDDWYDSYEIEYLDEDGIPVKIESYDEDGVLEESFEMKTKLGSGGGGDDDDGFFLPGFEAYALVVGGIAAVFVVGKVSRK